MKSGFYVTWQCRLSFFLGQISCTNPRTTIITSRNFRITQSTRSWLVDSYTTFETDVMKCSTENHVHSAVCVTTVRVVTVPCLPGLASCLYRPQNHLPSVFDLIFTLSRVTFTLLDIAHSISTPIKYLRLFLHIANRNWREMPSFTVMLSKAVVTGCPGGCRISIC
jgi:hypothetical protein